MSVCVLTNITNSRKPFVWLRSIWIYKMCALEYNIFYRLILVFKTSLERRMFINNLKMNASAFYLSMSQCMLKCHPPTSIHFLHLLRMFWNIRLIYYCEILELACHIFSSTFCKTNNLLKYATPHCRTTGKHSSLFYTMHCCGVIKFTVQRALFLQERDHSTINIFHKHSSNDC